MCYTLSDTTHVHIPEHHVVNCHDFIFIVMNNYIKYIFIKITFVVSTVDGSSNRTYTHYYGYQNTIKENHPPLFRNAFLSCLFKTMVKWSVVCISSASNCYRLGTCKNIHSGTSKYYIDILGLAGFVLLLCWGCPLTMIL